MKILIFIKCSRTSYYLKQQKSSSNLIVKQKNILILIENLNFLITSVNLCAHNPTHKMSWVQNVGTLEDMGRGEVRKTIIIINYYQPWQYQRLGERFLYHY